MFQEEYKYCYLNISPNITGTENNASACYEKASSYSRSQVDEIVERIILPVIASIGILGNIAGILHYGKNRIQTYYALMLALSISDLVTVFSFVLLYSLPIECTFNTPAESSTCIYASSWAYPIMYFAQLTGIYLTISLCFERYHAICRPLNHRFRRRMPYTYIIPIFSIAFIYNLPVFFEFVVTSENVEKWRSNGTHMTFTRNTTIYWNSLTNLRKNAAYQQIYHTGLKLILKCIIPYICLISLNVLIVKTLYGVRYTLSTDNTSQSDILDKMINTERQRKVTISSNAQSEPLHIHVSDKQQYIRRSQIDLAIVNLAIAIMFLISYSLIWVWAIYDFIQLLSSETDVKVSDISIPIISHILRYLYCNNIGYVFFLSSYCFIGHSRLASGINACIQNTRPFK